MSELSQIFKNRTLLGIKGSVRSVGPCFESSLPGKKNKICGSAASA